MKIAFLVYDSRSGSTLLSREVAAHFPEVYVSPEIRLDPLLGRRSGWWRRAGDGRVYERLLDGRLPEKLALPPAELKRISAEAQGIRPLIEALATQAAATQGRAAPAVALIKSGRHLRASRQILMDVPDARFVYIVRDPRAAIASKLVTDRPYVPGQKMAWAGTCAAALQWRWYGRLARRLGRKAPVLGLRYEALLDGHSNVLADLSRFLESPLGSGGSRYRVPPAEQAIHGRVLAAGIDVARTSAWRSELSEEDQAVIEILCGQEMRHWGYEAELRIERLRAARLVAKAFAVSAVRAVREAAQRASKSR